MELRLSAVNLESHPSVQQYVFRERERYVQGETSKKPITSKVNKNYVKGEPEEREIVLVF